MRGWKDRQDPDDRAIVVDDRRVPGDGARAAERRLWRSRYLGASKVQRARFTLSTIGRLLGNPCARSPIGRAGSLAASHQSYLAALGFGMASRISAAVVRPPCSLTILLKNTTPWRSMRNVDG